VSVETWLQPISGDDPCGPDLEYDPDFMGMEEASRETPGQEFGKDGGEAIRIQGTAANWTEVRAKAEGLLSRSKDLRVAVYLTRSLLHTDGFRGIADGLALIMGLLEQFWEAVHPLLDAEDDDDPTMRVNALVPLGALDAVVGDLRDSYVLRSRSRGQLTVREIEIAQGRLQGGADAAVLSESELLGLVAAAVEENPELPRLANEALAAVKAIGRIVGERVGESYAPDLKMLQSSLYNVVQAFAQGAPGAEEEVSDEMPADSAAPADGKKASGISGEIRSRQDVIQTLGRLCDYLSRNEPTNPVQLVLRRAQRMMNMSFLELMQDVAPDGLQQAETVVGEKLNKDEE